VVAPPMSVGGGSRQVIIRTASHDASAGYRARLPLQIYLESIIPRYSLKGKGRLTPPQWSGRRRLELASASRLGDPTVEPGRETPRATSYGNPPSRIWIGNVGG
jgi:hypothetical protein